MSHRFVRARFWRGGTSRGLLFRATDLAAYPQAVRDAVILAAMGSPDPFGRQISGLGGGVSSLSKAAIIGRPGEGAEKLGGAWPGVEWADEGKREGVGKWDIVYRFAQVGVREPTVDWSSTCGNMLAAVAASATSMLPRKLLLKRAGSLPTPPGGPLMVPVSVLSASSGSLLRAKIPLTPESLRLWVPEPGTGVKIAGVPEEGAGIELELPITTAWNGGLVTGRPRDVIELDGKEITISVLDAGLPNIFLTPESLDLPPSLLSLSVSALDAHPTLHPLLARIRETVSSRFFIPLSSSSPKIALVSPMLDDGYEASSGERVRRAEADLMVRAVSVGDFHKTIPGTTLGALNVGMGTPGTVIHDLIHADRGTPPTSAGDGEEIVTVRAAHPAGVAESSVKFVLDDESGARKSVSVVMMRTAREIMRGSVVVPERIFDGLD